jgi:pimeloyl-ACP methyl ester carboxylesterase
MRKDIAAHRIRCAKAGQARNLEAVIPAFTSFDGTVIAYEQAGSGEPVLLLHSFPFDSRVWHGTGVADAITAAGRSVIAADRRGSGRSARPHDPRAYSGNACARDVSSLIDHLELGQVDLAGYSVGSMIGLRVLQADPRIRRAVLGGVGADIVHLDPRLQEQVAADLTETDLAVLTGPAKAMRERIARLGGDPAALAALWKAPFVEYDASFDHVGADVLIITGDRDHDFGDPAALAARLPTATVFRPPADHASTMDHPLFAAGLIAHLSAPGP